MDVYYCYCFYSSYSFCFLFLASKSTIASDGIFVGSLTGRTSSGLLLLLSSLDYSLEMVSFYLKGVKNFKSYVAPVCANLEALLGANVSILASLKLTFFMYGAF